MTPYAKPLPTPTPWSKPFWEAARRHELVIQQCNDCKATIFYPKMLCPRCMSGNLGWAKARGRGKVYSFTVIESNPPSAFVHDSPYVVAVVRLEEGAQLMTNIVGCRPDEVRCDMPVEAVFEDVTPEFTLVKFRPAR